MGPTKQTTAAPTASYSANEKPSVGSTAESAPTGSLSLVDALRMYRVARKYTDNNYRGYWDQYFKVYKRQRVNRHYEGISDPVIPEAFTIIETLVANIAGGDVHFHFIKTNEEQTDETDTLNSLLDYYLECNNMGLKNQEWVRDMLLYGTGILHVTWENDKPKIDNVPLRDFFVNPQATNMSNATYAGFVYLGDKEVMRRQQVYDAAQDKMVPKYKNLDEVGFTTSGTGDKTKITDKQYKDQFQMSTIQDQVYANENQIFVVRLYDLLSGQMVEIGNDKDFILEGDIPFQRKEETRQVEVLVPGPTGGDSLVPKTVTQTMDAIDPFIPFAVLRDYIDTSQFFGEGEMAIIIDRSEMLNDLEAMDTDNLAYQNTPMYQIDPQFADMAPEIETIPGAVYPIPKGAISSLPIAEIAGNLDAKKDRVVAQMRSATAADEQIQGISQDQGRITATEVSSTLTQSQNRFSTKINNLQNEGYAQLGTILFKMFQIFVTEKQTVRILGKQGVYFKDMDPWDFSGEMEPHVELDSVSKQKQMEMGQKNAQLYQQLENSPIFDPVEVKRWVVQQIDPEMSDEAFNQLLAKQPPGPDEQTQKMQADIQKAELASVAAIYRWATPFIQAQIETILHMTPDPQHEVDEQHGAIQMGAQQADLLNPHTTAENQQDPSVPPIPAPAQPPSGMPAQQVAPQPA